MTVTRPKEKSPS